MKGSEGRRTGEGGGAIARRLPAFTISLPPWCGPLLTTRAAPYSVPRKGGGRFLHFENSLRR